MASPQRALSKHAGLDMHRVPQALASTGTGWGEKKDITGIVSPHFNNEEN